MEKLKAEGKEEDIHIPGRLFLKNTKLKKVSIGIDYAPNTRVHLSEDMFASNPELEQVSFYGANFRMPKTTFGHLEKLGESPYPMENRITDQNSSCQSTRPYTGGSSTATTVPAGTR